VAAGTVRQPLNLVVTRSQHGAIEVGDDWGIDGSATPARASKGYR
jgi:hypothetical protein